MKFLSNLFNLIKRVDINESMEKKKIDNNDLLESIKLLRLGRVKSGFSKNELALRTRISIVVIEAIENGRTKEFPEKAFLKQMLRKIEEVLALPEESLKPILNEASGPKTNNNLKTFTPLTINLFNFWYGNVIYIILMLTCIISMNRQQYDLSIKNTKTIKPLNSSLNITTDNYIKKDNLNNN